MPEVVDPKRPTLDQGDPTPHPLAEALGYRWLWLLRPHTETVILLHPTGLFTEVSTSFLEHVDDPAWEPIAEAMNGGVGELTGHASVCSKRDEDGTYSAWLEQRA